MTTSALDAMLTAGPFGLGTAPLGGLFTAVSEEDARATLEAAWAAGVRFFDTAPHYGTGLAEERLGAFLRDRPDGTALVSTKVGRVLVPGDSHRGDESFDVDTGLVRVHDYSADGVRRSLDDSLRRTGLDRFDLVLVHDPDDHWEQASTQAVPALITLRDEGVVGAVGVGMNQAAMLARFVRETDIDAVLVAGRFSLLDQSAADELFPLCRSRGVRVIVGGVFNSGILADPSPAAFFHYAPAPESALRQATRLRDACAAHGVPLAAAAIQFPRRHPAVTAVLVGARNAAEVEQNAEAVRVEIPEALWDDLDTIART